MEDFLARCLFQLRQDLPVHSLFASVRLMVYDLQRDWNSSEPAWSSTASSTCRMYVYRHNSSSTAYQPRIETKPDSFQRSKSSSCARFGSTWLSLHPSHTHTHTPHTSEPPSRRRTATRDQASMYSRDSVPGVVGGLACWMAPDQTARQACRGDPAVLHRHKIGWLTTATARFISFLARLWSVMMENSVPRVPSP